MRTGALYSPPGLRDLVVQALAGSIQQSEFLDRVITVEMAMRAAGARLV